MENIIKGIRQYYPVSDSSLEVLFSHMEKLELPFLQSSHFEYRYFGLLQSVSRYNPPDPI